jgi:hypothetical protein
LLECKHDQTFAGKLNGFFNSNLAWRYKLKDAANSGGSLCWPGIITTASTVALRDCSGKGAFLAMLLSNRKCNTKKKNYMVWVRERTIPTERPQLVGEVIANFYG